MTSPRRRTEGTGSPATDVAAALLTEFVRRGVTDLVLAPGSRSQALALVAAELERAAHLRVHVRVDERVAGFTALGLAAESGRPVPIVVTSGTAVANLHPAVLEAHHSGIRIVVLAADRPDELRGIGSNQTTEQRGIFGPLVPTTDVPAPDGSPGETEAARAVAAQAVAAHGPVHLNLSFREPLSAAWTAPPTIEPHDATPDADPAAPLVLAPAVGTVVVAGAGATEAAEAAARALDAPLLAEVVSGARFGPQLVGAYRDLLRDAEFGALVTRVIVFGHPTLSREIPALVARADVEVIVVRGAEPEVWRPGGRQVTVATALEIAPADDPRALRRWTGPWVVASRAMLDAAETAEAGAVDEVASASLTPAAQASYNRQVMADLRAPVTRGMLVRALWNSTWPRDRLVVAASRLARDLDRAAGPKKVRVHANRGLAGIDGTIATATGVALAAEAADPASGVTRVLIGDLALLHDAGAMLRQRAEAFPRLQVFVGDDGGGTIFDGLEVAQSAPAEAMERAFLTPPVVDFAALATAYGWHHRRVTTRGELEQALTSGEYPLLVEVPLPR